MNLPCKDCITLPICRSHVSKFSRKDYTALDILSGLYRKCSLLDNYLFGVNHYDDVVICLNDICDFLKGYDK